MTTTPILQLSSEPKGGKDDAMVPGSIVPDTSRAEEFPDSTPVSAKPSDAWNAGLVDGWLGLSKEHGESYFFAQDIRDLKEDLSQVHAHLVRAKTQRAVAAVDLAKEEAALADLETKLPAVHRHFDPSRVSFWIQAAVYTLIFAVAIFADLRFQGQMLEQLHLGNDLTRPSEGGNAASRAGNSVLPESPGTIAPQRPESAGFAIFRALTDFAPLFAIVLLGFSFKFLHDLFSRSLTSTEESRFVTWLERGGAIALVLLSVQILWGFGNLRGLLEEQQQQRARVAQVQDRISKETEEPRRVSLKKEEDDDIRTMELADKTARQGYDSAFTSATIGLSLFGAIAYIVLVHKHHNHYRVIEMRRSLRTCEERRKAWQEDLSKHDEAIARLEDQVATSDARLAEVQKHGGDTTTRYRYGYSRANDSPILFEPAPRFSNLLLRKASRLASRASGAA
ncbi:MAG TPA: hypothetical protein VEU96_02015 [Bryobacteraceae bacterium]|nr:hypothetical protein [Bryobacteraceae bacterium]